jgi:hypothetical protein
MVRIRRVAAIAILCALGAAYGTVSPAHADTPEVFKADALGRGLDLSVLGTALTLGEATSVVQSSTEAIGTGAGQVLSLTSPVLKTIATPANPNPAPNAEKCAGVDLPPPISPLLQLGLACGASAASFNNGLPIATGSGKVLGLSLNTGELLASVGVPAVGATLINTVKPILDVLDQAGQPLNLEVGDLLSKLIEGALNAQTLATATLGESTSSVVSDALQISSVGKASGAEIKLLPPPALGQISDVLKAVWNEPFVTVTVASAKATAVFDRKGGVASAAADPSLVSIHIASFLNILGLHDITVPVGQTLTILGGTPLESTIIVADGVTSTAADKSAAKAVADGVSLHLLKGISGGIKLALAHAEAGVGGKLATVTPKVAAVEVVRQLPRTGGPGPLFPALGVGVLVFVVVGRRMVLRTR